MDRLSGTSDSENFDQPVGAAVPIPDTVRGVFELIFDRDFINHIVVETN